MPEILMLYSTVDGHTANICQRIAQTLLAKGRSVRVKNMVDCAAEDLRTTDVIVIGASIRYGHHRPDVGAFIAQHRALLAQRATAFFSVNVVARKAGKDAPETNPYLQKFLRQVAWKPALQAVFAGRIDYPKCGFWDRHMIRLIMYLTHGPTDTSKAYEFTDWMQVDAFGYQLNALAESCGVGSDGCGADAVK
ncbi:menaquinone-dependent protoporphyrinogen IX dehydrogenase [Uliginosibacterium gangwonense]|uniref:menaquinone-dependent protoporphyrinogen IX dehydrogenase n=1 Tax=Uliginosibacterium gangwonense TaxID=392736 RepID=UPI0003787883|nr:menaquinone-dependent protoporphyrinogen IX dehydrogenase [Uliginosibacterium gangwonense]